MNAYAFLAIEEDSNLNSADLDSSHNLLTTSVDRFNYTYDMADNRLSRSNESNHAFDELYTYDTLNRLTLMKRGTLNSTNTAITGTVHRQQTWLLDALGNALGLTSKINGTTVGSESNAFDKQNRIQGYTYDDNGNNKIIGVGTYSTFDAWNRLVNVPQSNDDG